MKIYYYSDLELSVLQQHFSEKEFTFSEVQLPSPRSLTPIMRKVKVTLDVQENDSSYLYLALQAKPQLVLKFALPYYVEIPVGAWCEFQGKTYTLKCSQDFKKQGTRNIDYTITMGGDEDKLSDYKMRNSVDHRLKYSMCSTPREFIQEIVANLNERDGEGTWSVGECIESTEKTIEFNHTYIDDALQSVAETFETEWEIKDHVISLHSVEYFKDDPLPLSYGKGNGFVPGLGRSTQSDEKPIKRLYIQGGDRNIDRSKYGAPELLLPKSQTLEYEGRTYQSDADGYYIERVDKISDAVKEDSLDCSEIYPSRIGEVSAVQVINTAKNFYDIIDKDNTVNYSNYLIEGESMTLIFQSGMLAGDGKEFEVKYKHAEKRFEIVPQEIDGITMPNETFKPAIGDKYAIFGCMLPDEYVCDNENKSGASWDMFREGARHMFEHEDQKFTFTGTLQALYAKRNWLNIGRKLIVGGHILFSDEQFAPEGIVIRIVGIKRFLTNPYAPTIEISNSVSGSSVNSQLRKIDQQEVIIEDNHKQALQFTKRRFRDAQQTMEMLEDALDNYSSSINPITVQTMAMLVGDESLQFQFVKSLESMELDTDFQVTYDNAEKQLHVPHSFLRHMTLGINSIKSSHSIDEYKTWEMTEYVSAFLDAPEKKYYLYAKVSSSDTSQKGDFLLSESAIDMNSVEGYYHLLLGVLNAELEEERSYVSLFGFTEILPSRITTDRIVSADGKTFFDLAAGKIGGFIDFQDGLISGLIELGNEDGVNAGLSGEGTNATDVRFWAGDKATNKATAPFRVLHDGSLFASNADIEGKVSAGSGDDKISISASSGEGQMVLSSYGKVGYEKDVSFVGQFGMQYSCDKTGILRVKAVGKQAGSGQTTEIMGCAVNSPNLSASQAFLSRNLAAFFGQVLFLGKNLVFCESGDGETLSANTAQGDSFYFSSKGGTLQLPFIASQSRILFVTTLGTLTLTAIPTYTPMETYANIYVNGENKGRNYNIGRGAHILIGNLSGWFVLS